VRAPLFRLCNLIFVFLLLGSWQQAQAQPKPPLVDAYWLKLNAYEKSIWGGFQSKLRGDFWLTPNGADDPTAELQTTMDQMRSTDATLRAKTQCRYLARRDYLWRRFAWPENEQSPCPLADAWLKKLGASGVELIFASGYLDNAPSSFGHVFLKFHNPANQGPLSLLDYSVNFAARTQANQDALYAMYGLLGYFPGTFALVPYHQLIKDYVNLEGRDLWEYELNLNAAEVQRLLLVLLEQEHTSFDYYFLSTNCASEIMRLLELAKPGLDLGSLSPFAIPLDSLKRVVRSEGLVRTWSYRPSLQTQLQDQVAHLNQQQRRKLGQAFREQNAAGLAAADLRVVHLAASLAAYANHAQWDQFADQLARKAAHLPEAVGPTSELPPGPLPRPPQEGLDATTLGPGAFATQNSGQAIQGASLSARLAMQNLLSRTSGQPAWSELEAGSFEVRSTTSQQYFQRIRLLEALSTAPTSALSPHNSWGVQLEARQSGRDLWHLGPDLNVRYGSSVDFFQDQRLRLTGLALVSVVELPDQSVRPGLGMEGLILWQPFDFLRTAGQFEVATYAPQIRQQWKGKLMWDLAPQWELQTLWQSEIWQSDSVLASIPDLSLNIFYHFLW